MIARHFARPAELAPLLALLLASAQQAAPPHAPRTLGPPADDCNYNGVRDEIDLAVGTSPDCNLNLVPDECDLGRLELIDESFEAGMPPDWTTIGIAHVTDSCPRPFVCDGIRFIYFGDDDTCEFDDPNGGTPFGSVTLPDVLLPETALSIELSFCSAYEGEGAEPYDAADVFVNNVLMDHVSPVAQLQWETRTIDLTHLAGETVSVRFSFNAMDSAKNNFLGWQVDNVRLIANGIGGPSLDCNLNAVPDECEPDCDSNGVPDECEIASGTSPDCNVDGVPDPCQIASGASLDCNANLVPDDCDLTVDLNATVANLDLAQTTITGFFDARYAFIGGEEGTCIEDGGFDMFDCGNILNTDLGSAIPYSNMVPAASAAFGPQGRYVTTKFPGLFIMVATECEIGSFSITGDNGADGAGTVDSYDLSINVDGQPYSIYLKRVYDSWQASVNQIIAIPGDGTGVTHTYPPDTNSGEQVVSGLAGVDRVFYILVSRRSATSGGLPLRPTDAREIVREVVENTVDPVSSDTNDNGVPDECD